MTINLDTATAMLSLLGTTIVGYIGLSMKAALAPILANQKYHAQQINELVRDQAEQWRAIRQDRESIIRLQERILECSFHAEREQKRSYGDGGSPP